MVGTLVNVGTVLVGSVIGLAIHAKLPERITKIAFQAIGLFTMFLGFIMASKTGNFLIMIFSILPGSIIGELLHIERRMEGLSEFIKRKIGSKDSNFSEGLVTSFLLFCMGSMTILGAIEEGLGGKPNLLIAKAVLDGFSSLALASSLGIGVTFSIIPLFIYQGGITLFASTLQQVFTEVLIKELSAVGGLLLIGLGINLLEIKRLPVLNMLPALAISVFLTYFFSVLK
ncbi:MAG: DUF554 domain-containing protein [Syntrophorhabdaceae bacterium]|nr:DUF554 domain-containing protein [Syntrophorhabdaceae bacterium]